MNEFFKKHIILIPEAESPIQVLGSVLEFLDKNEYYNATDRFVCMNGFCMGLGLASQILDGNFDKPDVVNDFIKAIPDIYYKMMEGIHSGKFGDLENFGSDDEEDSPSIIGLN